MSNLLRRLRKLEEQLTDPSGLVPHSQKWLAYWDRQMYNNMTDQEQRKPVRFTVEAYRAVMKYASNPASLVAEGQMDGRIPGVGV